MSFYSILTSKASTSDRLMSMFAIIMAINYPLYLVIWLNSDQKGHLGIELRLVATALCLVLLCRKYWPFQIRKWLPIYWPGTVIFCLPFFFVYMTLKNHGEVLWLMNTLSALFFTLIMFDFFWALVNLTVGSLLAWVTFAALGNKFTFIPGTLTLAGALSTFFAAIIIGSIFTRIRGISEDEKYKELIANEAAQRSKLLYQEKFSALARKVAHDINSPLSALKIMIGLCQELPEEKRNVLHRATESILDIANNLIVNYQTNQPQHGIETEPHQTLLVTDLLIQLVSEKKIQYREKHIRFHVDIAENARFVFMRIQKSELRRAISNLINNAVDALEDKKEAKVTVGVTATNHAVTISVEDNGHGMAEESVKKMHQRRYFTEGKANGHGIGLRQVWDMLQENRGRLSVQSTLGQGTIVKLTFPRSAAAKWMVHEMRLLSDQIIVILDDEQSIHDAWNMHFASLLKTYPQIRMHHFTQGGKALSFMNGLPPAQRNKVILLSDYELLHQPKNGIEIIQASHIKNAILVTSNYDHPAVCEAVTKLKIKMLPKQMALLLPIHVETSPAVSTTTPE